MKNRGVPGMGLGESSWKGTPYGWLTGSMAGIGPKNTCTRTGVLFTGWGYWKQDPSDDMHSVITSHMPSARSLG